MPIAILTAFLVDADGDERGTNELDLGLGGAAYNGGVRRLRDQRPCSRHDEAPGRAIALVVEPADEPRDPKATLQRSDEAGAGSVGCNNRVQEWELSLLLIRTESIP